MRKIVTILIAILPLACVLDTETDPQEPVDTDGKADIWDIFSSDPTTTDLRSVWNHIKALDQYTITGRQDMFASPSTIAFADGGDGLIFSEASWGTGEELLENPEFELIAEYFEDEFDAEVPSYLVDIFLGFFDDTDRTDFTVDIEDVDQYMQAPATTDERLLAEFASDFNTEQGRNKDNIGMFGLNSEYGERREVLARFASENLGLTVDEDGLIVLDN